jgi:hypothetical protein
MALQRPKPARLGVAVCLAISIGTVCVQLPRAVASLDRRAHRSESFTYEDREFAAGNSIIPDKQLLYEARALIPPSGTYQVATGSARIAGASDLTVPFAGTFSTYFLMPRRPSPTSPWIVCLGCDVKALTASGAHVVWTDGAGSTLLRVGG